MAEEDARKVKQRQEAAMAEADAQQVREGLFGQAGLGGDWHRLRRHRSMLSQGASLLFTAAEAAAAC